MTLMSSSLNGTSCLSNNKVKGKVDLPIKHKENLGFALPLVVTCH